MTRHRDVFVRPRLNLGGPGRQEMSPEGWEKNKTDMDIKNKPSRTLLDRPVHACPLKLPMSGEAKVAEHGPIEPSPAEPSRDSPFSSSSGARAHVSSTSAFQVIAICLACTITIIWSSDAVGGHLLGMMLCHAMPCRAGLLFGPLNFLQSFLDMSGLVCSATARSVVVWASGRHPSQHPSHRCCCPLSSLDM